MRSKVYEEVQPISWVLDVIRQILFSIGQHIQPVYNRLVNITGGFDESSLYLTQIAIGLEPEYLGIAHIFNSLPYSNPTQIRLDLNNAVSAGWLKSVREGVFRASQKGYKFFQQYSKEIGQVYLELNPLPLRRLEHIYALLGKVVDAIRANTNFPYKPSFYLDLKIGVDDGPLLQRICCNLSHIIAYRDDCYVNAWMDQEINSYVWEAFSLIYQGKARTAYEISGKLSNCRNYDVKTYGSALRELELREWIKPVNGYYEPTNYGIMVLANVAQSMNKRFFEPWMELDENELNILRDLMESLAFSLKIRRQQYGAGYSDINRTIGWGSIQWVRDKIR